MAKVAGDASGRSARQRLSRATMVVVGLDGPALPKTARSPARALDLTGLVLLAELSSDAHDAVELAQRVARRCDSSPDAALDLVADLSHRGLLVDVHGTPPTREAPAPGDAAPVTSAVTGAVLRVLAVPTVFRIEAGTFEHRWHDGTVALALSPSELLAAASFRQPTSLDEAFERATAEHSAEPPDRATFDELAARLTAAGLLREFDPDSPDNGNLAATADEIRDAIRRKMRITHATKVAVEQHAASSAAHPGSAARVPVIPIHHNWVSPPLSLGLIVAFAKAYADGVLERSYDFVPRWLVQPDDIAEITERPAIFLFSNYIWNHAADLEHSARIKELSPNSLTIHGGPDTPKYESDVERYFRDNPHVDITIRGEGEATFAEALEAIAGRVGDSPADLSPLTDVAGLTFRLGDRLVTTPDRERIADLDTIPSPFLTGLFDSFAAGPARAAMVETNRGCPYGCTFCDWGSATLSRIRKFDIDRVFAEIEWCAKNGFENISLCDANFGIFERDVAIAEKFAEVKRTYGYPHTVGNNYAKNTVKHLEKIIKIFADAGIVAEGIISLQSMDADTLQVIRRKNIKVEKYTELAAEFGANRLPLAVDLMMALPGATIDAYHRDLQECVDRDVRTRIHPTTMLANSPMNEPSYRAEHGIVALPGELVKRTNTFDETDWQYMWDLRQVFLLCDLFSVLRHVARYVRSETGVHEVAFYDQLMRDAFADPDRWPTTTFTFRSIADLMVPPCSWSLFVDEVGDYLTTVMDIPDDAALRALLEVQLAHLPARDRVHFPEVLTLDHDVVAWHRARVAACDAGHRSDWEHHVPALRTFGPGTLTVDDPEQVCRNDMGGDVTLFGIRLSAWDFESPVARPRNVVTAREVAEPSSPDGRGDVGEPGPGTDAEPHGPSSGAAAQTVPVAVAVRAPDLSGASEPMPRSNGIGALVRNLRRRPLRPHPTGVSTIEGSDQTQSVPGTPSGTAITEPGPMASDAER